MENKQTNINTNWMELAKYMSNKSSCVRRHVGAVIVKDNKLLSYGYNHTPDGIPQCTEKTCIRKVNNIASGTRHEMCLAVHAEQNAILMALKLKKDIQDSTIYVTDSPCIICTKLLINAGIKKVIYASNYPDELSLSLLKQVGIEIEKFEQTDLIEKDSKIRIRQLVD